MGHRNAALKAVSQMASFGGKERFGSVQFSRSVMSDSL